MKANKGEKQIDKEGHRISMKILAKVSLTFLSTFLQHRSPTFLSWHCQYYYGTSFAFVKVRRGNWLDCYQPNLNFSSRNKYRKENCKTSSCLSASRLTFNKIKGTFEVITKIRWLCSTKCICYRYTAGVVVHDCH